MENDIYDIIPESETRFYKNETYLDAKTAYKNSGWFDCLHYDIEDEEHAKIIDFIYRNGEKWMSIGEIDELIYKYMSINPEKYNTDDYF